MTCTPAHSLLLLLVLLAPASAQDVAPTASAATPFGVALAAARADGSLARLAGERFFRPDVGGIKVQTVAVTLREGDELEVESMTLRKDDVARVESFRFDRSGRLTNVHLLVGGARGVASTIGGKREGEELHLHVRGANEDYVATRPCPSDALPLTVAFLLLPALAEHLPAGASFPTLIGTDLLTERTTLSVAERTAPRPNGTATARCWLVQNASKELGSLQLPVWVATEGDLRGQIEGFVHGVYMQAIPPAEGRLLVAPTPRPNDQPRPRAPQPPGPPVPGGHGPPAPRR